MPGPGYVLLLHNGDAESSPITRANLADEIERIWEADKKTCVLITNDVDEAIILADRIIALNPDGTKKWEFLTGGHVGSSPAIGADGTVYVGSWDNKVHAIGP